MWLFSNGSAIYLAYISMLYENVMDSFYRMEKMLLVSNSIVPYR